MLEQNKIFITIFLCSLSSLAYEVALTRIFSISLWYHFAFMIISIAMLGIGASGTLLSLYPRFKNLSNIDLYALLLGTGIFLGYHITNLLPFDPIKLSWSKTQIIYIGIYYIVLSIPFFFTGLIVATAFSFFKERPWLIYGADLLGAGSGAIFILLLMFLIAPEKAVLIFSSISFLAAFIYGSKRLKKVAFVLIILNSSLFIIHPSFINLNISPYKGLELALKYPGAKHLKTYYSPYARIDTFKSPFVRFAPGLSLKYLEPLPEQIGFSIDGGDVNAITKSDNKRALEFIKYLPSALPYEIVSYRKKHYEKMKSDVLILESKGGLQALVAQHYNISNIYKIESNPLLIKVIKKDFNEFSGGIYSSNTASGLGRAWLKYNNKKFDLIDIPLMGSSPSGSFGISEDYRFTIEAFKEYINHLKDDGIFSLNMFILPPPRIELRLLNTVITAMEELGIKEVEKHVVAIRSWASICILIKKSAFNLDEIKIIKNFSEDLWFDIVYYPSIGEDETNIYVKMPSNEYLEAFRNLLYHDTRRQFTDSYIFDIKPVCDDNPFFNYYLKLKNIRKIYSIMGQKWQYFIEEGYILPVVFIQVMLLSLAFIFLPVFSKRFKYNPLKSSTAMFYFLPYFAFIGAGFMFVEISIIHKMILPLENPSYALASVLTSILISSGIGSILSYKIRYLRSPLVILLISILIIIYSILFTVIPDLIIRYSKIIKILLACLLLLPLGLLMGIPFPQGIKILGDKNEGLIPWAWAINACFSVLTPILAVMVAIAFGFKIVLWLGSASYLLAFLTFKKYLK